MPEELNLKEKGGLVESLWHAVNDASGSLANVPALIQRVIETEAWRERSYRGKTYKHSTLLSFITTKPLAGCGWPQDKVEALLRDDALALTMWRKAITPAVGSNQYTQGNNNVMTRQGNSRAYTLDRLKRERPDLYNRVVIHELSANAAAIEAGFRDPPTPLLVLQRAWKRATSAEQTEFLEWIKSHGRQV